VVIVHSTKPEWNLSPSGQERRLRAAVLMSAFPSDIDGLVDVEGDRRLGKIRELQDAYLPINGREPQESEGRSKIP
jgi:hypothetical protein